MPIVDTHSHVGIPEQMPPDVPAIRRKHPCQPVEVLIGEMEQHGVDRAVLVQYSGYYDNTYITRCVVEHPGRFTSVADLDETDNHSIQALESLASHGYIQGIRLSCRLRMPGRDPFALWRKAFELDLLVSAGANVVDHYSEGLGEILEEFPELRLKIEHLGRPDVGEPPPCPRFRKLLELAKYPNVYMNIDGFYAYRYPSKNDPEGKPVVNTMPYESYLPFVRRAYDAFGPQRLMWGSDFPFTLRANGYDAGLGFIREACGFMTSEDKEWILGRAAMNVYRFGVDSHGA